MKAIIDYKKENSELTGSIMINEYASKTTYIAVTASASKTYKSLKGAEKFMAEYNYKKI
ncbi:hypothetical protein [Bacteroides finegoldii]|jgi:hypothetical protein|uniref:hypothetical protein n=1 Tax=Bacteroides finegoldii TaxID=338188 RepID=UPI00189F31FC|nr:hypothetical protein [Bacteroides finegoldii]